MKAFKTTSISLTTCLVLSLLTHLAMATEDAKELLEDIDAKNITEEIVIFGIRRSIKESLAVKQDAINVIDAVVAEDIGKFPDQNIAEALQRMTGITITRNGGEGQNITVRGLGGDYNVTTINGRRMASEHRSRNFNYDLIAAELLSSIEVYKSPVALSQEGGIGSVINIKTRRPMDLDDFTLSGSVKGIYEDRTEDLNPQLSFLISKVNDDDSFGVLFTMVYSERTLRTDTYYGYGYYDESEDPTYTIKDDVNRNGVFDAGIDKEYGSVIPGYTGYIHWEDTRKRVGATMALQWIPSEDVQVNLDFLYSSYDTNGSRSQLAILTYDEYWTPGIPAVSNLGFNDAGLVNDVTLSDGAMLELLNTSKPRTTDTFQLGLNTAWQFNDDLSFVVDISHSESKNKNNGDDRFIVARGFVDSIRLDHSGGNLLPDVTMAPIITNEAAFGAHYSNNSSTQIGDKVSEIRLDGIWEPGIEWVTNVKFGFNYGMQSKDRTIQASKNSSAFSNGGQYLTRYPQYDPDLSSVESFNGQHLFRLPADVVLTPNFDNFLAGEPGKHPHPWPRFDYDKLFAFYETISPGAANDLIKASIRPKDSFTVGEDTFAIYLQTDIENTVFDLPFMLNLGVRAVQTTVTNTGFSLDIDRVQLITTSSGRVRYVGALAQYQQVVNFEDSYTDVLPSFNFKLNLRNNLLLRLSGAQVITRPPIKSLAAYASLNLRRLRYYASNPGLNPLRATQFDIAFEWYINDHSALTIAAFNKNIDSFIETGETGTKNISGYTFNVFSPKNGDFGGRINGVELAFQQSFTDIFVSPFNGFGVQLNYTYVDSSYEKPSLKTAGLPFQGMPNNSYNAVVYYEKAAIQARLAYNWRGELLANPNGLGGPEWDTAYGQYDFSSTYTFSEKIDVHFSVNNITNEHNWSYISRPEQVRKLALYGRLINLGISYIF